MKRFILSVVCVFLAGCSTQSGYLGHSINTEVVLKESNFVVLGTVEGKAEGLYILGIGLGAGDLFSEAKYTMVKNGKLKGKSRALANIVTDVQHTTFLFPLFYQKTVYVSGELIEFIPQGNVAKQRSEDETSAE